MDIIELFEDMAPAAADRVASNGKAPVDLALREVLGEIDDNARATFSSITVATMLHLIERQQGGALRRG